MNLTRIMIWKFKENQILTEKVNKHFYECVKFEIDILSSMRRAANDSTDGNYLSLSKDYGA